MYQSIAASLPSRCFLNGPKQCFSLRTSAAKIFQEMRDMNSTLAITKAEKNECAGNLIADYLNIFRPLNLFATVINYFRNHHIDLGTEYKLI